MVKRISWKKGMRLTDEILTLSDECHSYLVSTAFTLGSAGRIGLIPSTRPFNVDLNISNEFVEVTSLDCVGITRNGSLIDVQYDTDFTNSIDRRVMISHLDCNQSYLLCITYFDSWRDSNDGLCEPDYKFKVIEEDSVVSDNSLPIARLVYDGIHWHKDETDFLPPCLYLSSHRKYLELADKFLLNLKNLDRLLSCNKFKTEQDDARKIFWPEVRRLMITVNNEQKIMSPMSLFANIQNLIGTFLCACDLDAGINLGEPQPFVNYINLTYSQKDEYRYINEGLNLSLEIQSKVNKFDSVEPEPQPQPTIVSPPSIARDQMQQMVKCGPATIKITNNAPGSSIYYTTDGTIPSQSSNKGDVIIIETGFADDWHKEPPINIQVKAVAYKEGKSSSVETFNVIIKKNNNPFSGKVICS
jgi:hypothetical protein